MSGYEGRKEKCTILEAALQHPRVPTSVRSDFAVRMKHVPKDWLLIDILGHIAGHVRVEDY